MSKEEPAWKAELETGLEEALGWRAEFVIGFVAKQIAAAEQRGREAGLLAMAAILRGTPKDSRDYPAALTGARLIEDALDSP